MRDALFEFLDDLNRIGKSDESLFDTGVKDDLLSVLLQYSESRVLSLPDDFGFFEQPSNELAKKAFVALAEKFEAAAVEENLEQVIRNITASSDPQSKHMMRLDELFGDFFFEDVGQNRRHIYASVRNFFYSRTCYLVFMLAPPMSVFLAAFLLRPKLLASGLMFLVLVLVAFLSMLAGVRAYDYARYRIQKYEGVPGARW